LFRPAGRQLVADHLASAEREKQFCLTGRGRGSVPAELTANRDSWRGEALAARPADSRTRANPTATPPGLIQRVQRIPVGAGAQLLQVRQADPLREETDRAVAQRYVGAAGVEGVDLPLVGAVDAAGAGNVGGQGERGARRIRA